MNHWLIIVNKVEALEWIFENGKMAFRDRVNTDDLRKGDRFAIYATKAAFGSRDRDESQIAALGHLTSDVMQGTAEIAGETFPKGCSVSIDLALPVRQGVVFRGFIGHLDLVPTARQWPGAVHRTLAPISESDYKVLTDAVRLAAP